MSLDHCLERNAMLWNRIIAYIERKEHFWRQIFLVAENSRFVRAGRPKIGHTTQKSRRYAAVSMFFSNYSYPSRAMLLHTSNTSKSLRHHHSILVSIWPLREHEVCTCPLCRFHLLSGDAGILLSHVGSDDTKRIS